MRRFLVVLIIFFLFSSPVWGKETSSPLKAQVVEVFSQEEKQTLTLLLLEGENKGKQVGGENQFSLGKISPRYQPGDLVWVVFDSQENRFQTIDFVRSPALLRLFLLFLFLVLVVARRQGLFSLLGTTLSFLIIFGFLLPQINQGKNPLAISLAASLFLVPATFYLSHGFNRKTTTAVIASLLSLFLTVILAQVFVRTAHLSGFASEETGFVWDLKEGKINPQGLLLAGIIIGILGVLDDITVSQAAVIEQLRQTSHLSPTQLFWRGMKVGEDHIASMVNTLILVYAGASLPLLLLFLNRSEPFSFLINQEIVAEEVVRTLVASVGLVAAVPLTTFLAAFWPLEKRKDQKVKRKVSP